MGHIRVEITREKYMEITGLEVGPDSTGVTHLGTGGPIQYVFIEPDEPDTSRSEIEFLEQLYKL